MINLIIAPISFSKGKAGSMRLQYLVNELRKNEDLIITNLITRNFENEIDEKYYKENVYKNTILNNKHFAFLPNIFKIINLLKNKKKDKNILYYYDVNYNPLDFLFFLVAKFLGYKIVFDEVELYKTKLFKSESDGFIRILIISINQFFIKFISDYTFCISKKILNVFNKNSTILPISYNSKLLELKRNKQNDRIQILYAGSFAEKDNINDLLIAIRNLKNKVLKFELLFCGKIANKRQEQIEKILEKYQIKEYVKILGFLSNEEYNEVLINSDIGIIPRTNSKFSNAGFPFKLGEFLITENAVVVSDVSDIRDYLDDTDCFIIKPNSTIEMENALYELITNTEKRLRMGKLGKEKAIRHFNPTEHSNIIINKIKTL